MYYNYEEYYEPSVMDEILEEFQQKCKEALLDDINPSIDYSKSLTMALQNFQTNTSALFNAKKQYCEKCKNEIEGFINNYVKEI